MGAAIWSTPANEMLAFPAASFARFFANHGLLQVRNRPQWRTVVGGSRTYVAKVAADAGFETRTGVGVARIERTGHGVDVTTRAGVCDTFDSCVMACHADEALEILADRSEQEVRTLSAFRYAKNEAVLHRDASVMPRRRKVWASWNYTASDLPASMSQRSPANTTDDHLAVTYWMNSLQPLATSEDWFVTLNPLAAIDPTQVHTTETYTHPIFDAAAIGAQRDLWALQGRHNTWFCGSYFGYGFHEDALQSGLAAAEDLAGIARPWSNPDTGDVDALAGRLNDRLKLPEGWAPATAAMARMQATVESDIGRAPKSFGGGRGAQASSDLHSSSVK